jgi:hypothetical protein
MNVPGRGRPQRGGPQSRGHAEEEPEDVGNGVYRIAPDGSVSMVLRGDQTVLALALRDDELIVGTGTEGKIYSLRPDAEAETLIGRLESENAMSLFAARDGTIYCGASNSGALYTLSAQRATKGTFTSDVLDAKHVAHWGTAALTAGVPAGAKATLAVRSGNVKDPKNNEKFWTDWSAEVLAGADQKIPLPAARYLQYRLTLSANGQGESPVVDEVTLSYQVPNLGPKIHDITIDNGGGGGPGKPDKSGGPKGAGPNPGGAADKGDGGRTIHIAWEATDSNQDDLVYRLYYRAVGTETWLPLAKDVTDSQYDWPVAAVPDGKYQVKVVASDAPDNPAGQVRQSAQVSAPFLVVGTLPSVADIKAAVAGAKVDVTGIAKAHLCAVADVRFQVDGQGDWQPAAPSDKLFDSPTEGFTLTTRALAVGAHVITVRVTDALGNIGYQAVTVEIK